MDSTSVPDSLVGTKSPGEFLARRDWWPGGTKMQRWKNCMFPRKMRCLRFFYVVKFGEQQKSSNEHPES